MAKKCMKCGGAMKMAKGGSVSKPFAAGIPYATGAGATDGKNGMMQKGGAVSKTYTGKKGSTTKTSSVLGTDIMHKGKKGATSTKYGGSEITHKGKKGTTIVGLGSKAHMGKKGTTYVNTSEDGSKNTVVYLSNDSKKPVYRKTNSNMVAKKMQKGGETKFGMLSVKAGIDKNPKATAADRIAGAKKNAKKK